MASSMIPTALLRELQGSGRSGALGGSGAMRGLELWEALELWSSGSSGCSGALGGLDDLELWSSGSLGTMDALELWKALELRSSRTREVWRSAIEGEGIKISDQAKQEETIRKAPPKSIVKTIVPWGGGLLITSPGYYYQPIIE